MRLEIKDAWYASLFTGLFTASGPMPRLAHDPDVSIWSGEMPGEPSAAGGAGWDEASAEAAEVGEAIERWQSWRLPCDRSVEASYSDWPLDQPAVAPERWVLFHPEQYRLPNFPYRPLDPGTVCRWVGMRQACTGLPIWVPEEFVYLSMPADRSTQLCPLISTGLACGRWGQPVLLRGLQEVIERDAVMGAWWGRYPLEEHAVGAVFGALDAGLFARLMRPNLRYRFYRVGTPFSDNVTLVTLEGEDREGYCFSVGSACRETRSASWLKSLLEVVQGRHYVRYLKARLRREGRRLDVPASFADHAVYYSAYPERLSLSPFRSGEGPGVRAPGPKLSSAGENLEDIAALEKRLGPEHPILFRNLTPPGLAMERMDWCVLRVVAPGLQPLHGHHALPFLGGPLWAPRTWKDWAKMQPHPFP